jgi:peptide/nickel transport system substrate-binding protein
MLKNLTKLFTLLAIIFFISSCATEKSKDIVIWQSSDPVMLNPMNAVDAGSRRMMERIFQSLLKINYSTYELVPVLAKSRPIIKEISDSTTTMEFEIREEAVWDDTGEPITGEDVAFSLKVMKAPGIQNSALRVYFDYIKDIQIDETNPKKFILTCERYMIMESTLADLMICPKHIYDPEGILDDYTVSDFSNPATYKDLTENEALKGYADFFNAPDFQNNIVVGSGPYVLDSWEPTQKIVLRLKTNWWANKVENTNDWLKATPKKLIYKTIPDMNTAVAALEAEEIDVMYRIDPRKFTEELREDSTFINTFHTGTPSQFIYSYMGMNKDNPKLADVNTRRALRLLMDVDNYSKTTFYGLSERVTTFIHPSTKIFINEDLKFQPFNIEQAKILLEKAGWKDSNQDGILDKIIDEQTVDFKIEVLYPSVATTSEDGVLIFKDGCKKVGIEIVPIALDYRVFLEKMKARKFDMYFGLWQASPVESDPSQLWHTNAITNGGQNYTGFGNAKSDKILEAIQKELDINKRAILYKELQQMIDDEATYIFLIAVKNRVAIHKRIKDPNYSSMGNGFWSQGFELIESEE